MFVDACAIIAILSDEREADRVSEALASTEHRMTSPVAHRYRAGPHGLNLGDCLHYACARFYGVPILATDNEFWQTDLETIP